MNKSESNQSLTGYHVGSKVSRVAPLSEIAPRSFSYTGPIIPYKTTTVAVADVDAANDVVQKKKTKQTWLAEKFEKMLGLSSEGSSIVEDSSKMTYEKCIHLHLPMEKFNELQTNFAETQKKR